jgi:hypothetical protein
MRTTCRHMILSVIWSVAAVQCDAAYLGKTEPSASELDGAISRAENLWKMGKSREYYLMIDTILQDSKHTSPKKHESDVAAELLRSLLSKEPDTEADTIWTTDILITQKVASHLVYSPATSSDERQASVRLLSCYLGRLRKEIVPNYRRKLVLRNVCPPVIGQSTVPLSAGMDPKAIDDPTARAAYEAAIKENCRNNLMNARQYDLREAEQQLCKPIIAYMIETLRVEDKQSPLVAECIKSARLTEEETKKMESVVGSRNRSGKTDGAMNDERRNTP